MHRMSNFYRPRRIGGMLLNYRQQIPGIVRKMLPVERRVIARRPQIEYVPQHRDSGDGMTFFIKPHLNELVSLIQSLQWLSEAKFRIIAAQLVQNVVRPIELARRRPIKVRLIADLRVTRFNHRLWWYIGLFLETGLFLGTGLFNLFGGIRLDLVRHRNSNRIGDGMGSAANRDLENKFRVFAHFRRYEERTVGSGINQRPPRDHQFVPSECRAYWLPILHTRGCC